MNQYKLYTMDEEKTCNDELTERDEPCCKEPCCEEEIRPGNNTFTNGLSNTIGNGGELRELLESRPDGGPTPNRHHKIHDMVIKQMDLGYLVKVGCQTLCFETKERLIDLFTSYINDPEQTMDSHYRGTLLNEETKAE